MNCIKFCYHNYSLFFNSLFKKRWMRKGGGEEKKKKTSPIYTTQRGWWKWDIHKLKYFGQMNNKINIL
jgi:hypothetical protein